MVSVGTNEKAVESMLIDLGVILIQEVNEIGEQTKIYLNGKLLGVHPNVKPLIEQIRFKRRKGEIDNNVNCSYYPQSNEAQLNSDAGRARRPLFVVHNGKLLMDDSYLDKLKKREYTWNDLVNLGLIEYFDSEEEENAYIAISPEQITKEHTHCEISPAAILGITASLIPFPEHNQSPRNTYEASMAKQALGIYASNFHLRLDTRGHILHYPQSPLVQTRAMEIIGFDKRPAGQNFVVGIMSFHGFNIEDALIINKCSIERGLGRSTFFRTYEAEERKYPGGVMDKFETPASNTLGVQQSESYSQLGEDGIIDPEREVEPNDVLIGRTSPPKYTKSYEKI